MSKVLDVLEKYLKLTPRDSDTLNRTLTQIEDVAWGIGGRVGSRGQVAEVRTGNTLISTTDGITLYNPSTGARSIYLAPEGDAFFGKDIDTPADASLVIFSNAQVYNQEEMGDGDVLLGDNSSGKANLVWDRSSGKLSFRGGTTMQVEIGTDGKLYAGAGVVSLSSAGISVRADGIGFAEDEYKIKIVNNTGSMMYMYAYQGSQAVPWQAYLVADGDTQTHEVDLEIIANRGWINIKPDKASAYHTYIDSDLHVTGHERVGGGIYAGALDVAPSVGYIQAANRLIADGTGNFNGLFVGGDTQLYRSAANVLRTPDDFQSDTKVTAAGDGSTAGVFIGTDTQLYRSAANVIRTPDSLVVDGNLYTVDWTDYSGTSTLTGWSSTTTNKIWYKKVGDLVFVRFSIFGTSNATTTSFTLPYTASNATNEGAAIALIRAQDNGTWQAAGMVSVSANSNVANCYINSDTASVWTNSGTKVIQGEFFYRAA